MSEFKVSDFYDEGPSFPNKEAYPESEEFEWYFNAGLRPEDFENSDPEFGKRYAAWISNQKGA